MALFFNLEKLEQLSNNDSVSLLTYLWYHWTKSIAKTEKELKYVNKGLQGGSFILNPRELFEDRTTDILYKIQYIKLAGRRDYGLFRQYGYKALNISYFPDLNISTISHNPLLIINNKEISFKYE